MIKDLSKDLISAATEILNSSEKKIEEVVAVPVDGLANKGVIGARQNPEVPVCVDIVKDSDPMNGTFGFRALIEHVNNWHEFVPSTDKPAAKTLDELKSMCSGMVGYVEKILPAIEKCSFLPSDEPRYRGNDKK